MNNLKSLIIITNYIFYLCSFLFYKGKAKDIFASTENIKLLLHTDRDFSHFVDIYLNKEEARLTKLETFFADFMQNGFSEGKDSSNYLHNPINIFRFIKYATTGMKNIVSLMNISSIKDTVSLLEKNNKTAIFPNENDFKGCALALARLKNIYNLNISKMVRGEIVGGIKSLKQMTALDCHHVGRTLAEMGDMNKAVFWYKEAITIKIAEKENDITKLKLMNDLALAYEKISRFEEALDLFKEILKIDPQHPKIENKIEHLKLVKEIQNKKPKMIIQSIDGTDIKHQSLCLNKDMQKISNNLNCYYSNRMPILMIQRIKVEIVHVKPMIALLYNIVSDNEMEILKKVAVTELKRAGVGNRKIHSSRLSKNSWLEDGDHPVVGKLSRTLEDITGLDILNGSELLQVNNYGIAGHYDPHHDYLEAGTAYSQYEDWGNRIATFLIYLSDVKAGGLTVFPLLDLAVIPQKGSAVFWYNLYKTGERDVKTLHASCPVLLGNKWVCNKWIRQYPQMFRKSCGKSEKDLYHTI